jgi:hypothetical protein
MNNFEELIGNLDLKLLEKIKSQADENDLKSRLACQLASRGLQANYNYLEIGSYLGGSIQPYLLDEKCTKIYSIDKRPLQQPDERGVDYIYLNNSTARMLELLKEVAPIEKITTIDGDSGDINPDKISDKVQVSFIDGEHTDQAVMRDFKFCLRVSAENCVIAFDDASIVYNGIGDCIEYLKSEKIKFNAYCLPSKFFVIEIGDFPIHLHQAIMQRLINNHESFIYSLKDNKYYRDFANKYPFRLYRKIISKIHGSNISE